MEKMILKSQFKSLISYYFRKVEKTGMVLINSDKGKPVLRMVPYEEDPDNLLLPLRNTVIQYIEPTEPVGFED